MSGFLRFVGVVNAAIWLGGSVFFAVFILPAVFSANMHTVLPTVAGAENKDFYQGAVALVLFRKFFWLHYLCGVVALLHLYAEKLYLGRPLPRLATAIVAGIFFMALVGGVWLQPKMEALREVRYRAPTVEQRDTARKSFVAWHVVSVLANYALLAGLVVHVMRVTRPDDSKRYISFSKFWG